MPNVFDQFDEKNPFDKFDAQKAEPVTDFSGNLRLGPFDTGIPLPQVVNKGLAQVGSGLADWSLGARQLLASDKRDTLSSLVTGQTEADKLKAEAADKRKFDVQLNDGIVGKGLNILGQVAPSFALPFGYLGALGRAAPVVEGAIAGATQGAFQPVAPGESRAANVAIGSGAGAALPAVVQGVRALATPRAGDLARQAIEHYNIPLGVADISDSRLVKGARSMLNDLPLTGYMGGNDRQAIQGAFNREVGRTFGAPSESLDAGVMAGARQRIGGELDRIWDNNNLRLDGQFVTDLNHQIGRMQNLNPQQADAVHRQIQTLLQRVDRNGEIPGSFVNNWQSELRLAADGEKGLHQDILNNVRRATINTFNRSVTGADADALTTARAQYKAFKTVEPLMNKVEAGVGGRTAGDVPAALLPAQVVQSYGNRVAQSPFADLSAIGGRYLVDRTPQTGGSVRALMQNGTLAAASGAGGLGLAAMFGHLPVAAAGLGVAAGTQGMLGSTRAARSLLTPAAQRGLLAAPELTPALRELLSTSVQRAPIPLGLGLLTAPSLE